MDEQIVIIADIVDSRGRHGRGRSQLEIEETIAEVESVIRPRSNLVPTVGDELQGTYRSVEDALMTTMLIRLRTVTVECRFGIGVGTSDPVDTASERPILDGSAWWSAREAIEQVGQLASKQHRTLRTWYRVPAEITSASVPQPWITNRYLLARDEIIGRMSDRTRRLAYGRLTGVSQIDLAEREGISRSAVSQQLRRNGALALLEPSDGTGTGRR